MFERFPLTEPWVLSLDEVGEYANTPIEVTGIAQLGNTVEGDICFCDREPVIDLAKVAAGTIILCTRDLVACLGERFPNTICVAMVDPRAFFMDLGHRLLSMGKVAVSEDIPRPFGVHPTAQIGAQTIIHPEVRIDEGVRIGAQCVIHRGSWIQAGTIIRDHVVVGGDGVNIYLGKDGRRRCFPHFGSVIVGENVEIGAGVVIMSGILTHTRIGRESVIGNLGNIGHSAQIGEKVWMSVGCLIGGLTRIGREATLGMGVVIRDSIQIGEKAQVGMASVVVKSVAADTSVFGNPARAMPGIQAGPAR